MMSCVRRSVTRFARAWAISTKSSQPLETLEPLKQEAFGRTVLRKTLAKLIHIAPEQCKIDLAHFSKRVVELVDHGRRSHAALRGVELDHVIRPRSFSSRCRELRGKTPGLIDERWCDPFSRTARFDDVRERRGK